MNVSCKQQMEKHISKSIKILFKKKQKSVIFEPRTLPPFPPAPYPDSVLWFRLQSLSLPLTCSQRAFSLGGAVCHVSSWPPAVCRWGWVPGKCGGEVKVPFFYSVPTYQTEGALWVWWFENTAVLIILFFLWLMSQWFHFRQMLPSRCSSSRARVSLRSFPLSPTPVPEPWLTDFTQKEAQTKKKTDSS